MCNTHGAGIATEATHARTREPRRQIIRRKFSSSVSMLRGLLCATFGMGSNSTYAQTCVGGAFADAPVEPE